MITRIKKVIKKYWGYGDFLPLQEQAIKCAVEGRDSVVVLPTGGGKSLCFQAPAVASPGLAIVVSPLISLMKDQVDALVENGVSAARVDSSLSYQEREAVRAEIREGKLKLLYVSPERIVTDSFVDWLGKIEVSLIAIDEAHCVSMWGHDFRPEYREMGILKKALPAIPVHAYTATATQQVREDIAKQLLLNDPEMLVGSFDRPNLIYKAERRTDRFKQVRQVLDRHKNESGIIYCIRRNDVDTLCAKLLDKGYRAAGYHAGMEDQQRKRNQDAFIEEKVDTIVATVAFGMGIDKSNVRYVIHAGMPKSLEHYQQESGRAGRDGLEAECCLFYSGGDFHIWNRILEDMESQPQEIALNKLNEMHNYCTSMSCRHNSLVNYFGQSLDNKDCSACDVCLGEMDYMEDSLATSQKILSGIAQLEERFGADYTALVLTGSHDQRILNNQHDTLNTYSLLSEYKKNIVRNWIEQLVDQGYIEKTGEYNVLRIAPQGRQVLDGEITPRLLEPARKPVKVSKTITDSWEDVDRALFEHLRILRRDIAESKNVPAFVVFGDVTLRDMARIKPANSSEFLSVKGVGEHKNKQYGAAFLDAIKTYST